MPADPTPRAGIELLLLGPFEARSGGVLAGLGGAKPRTLLADLALNLGVVVSVDRLIYDLWGDGVPETAGHAVQVYVSELRKALGSGLIVTRAPGYTLELDPDRIDTHRFSRLVDEGRAALRAGNAAYASTAFRDALALRRGAALADFTFEPFAQLEIARLEELHQACLEGRIEADLGLGRHGDLVGELEVLVAAEPFRERLRAQLMLALYRCGRQADALAAYHETRRLLDEELGIEPGPELRALETAILRQDEALSAPALTVEPPVVEQRKLVSVLYAGLTGSTTPAASLDPEVLHRAVARYSDTVVAVLERYGGTAERLPGDAVMAVFGVPIANEDDALRAARAAVDLRAAVAALSVELGLALEVGIGLETGEVLAASPAPGRRLVSGEAVGIAARLQQAAAPGEILAGALAARLIGHAARLETLDPSRAAVAFRLLDIDAVSPSFERRLDAPLVGRERELVRLHGAFGLSVATNTAQGILVVGPAGIGKSRLASELEGAALGATVLYGRCLSYGDGITYWPLSGGLLAAASAETRKAILDLLAGEEDAELVAGSLAALGTGEQLPSAGEVAWAFRRLCETLARQRPLVLVFDDLHWAEPTFLDLVEHLVDQVTDAPILVVCLAREELLADRPGFLETGRIGLDALSVADTEALVDQLLADRALPEMDRARLVATADGNPLFLEQLLAFVDDEAPVHGRALPATIQALLAARLDRLGPGERAVIERAAIVGKEFQELEVAALLEPAAASTVGRHLQALAGRGFVRGGFSFRHVLIQEAAYRATPKEERARLHERFADWLERNATAPELDELIGFHLERAYRLRLELGAPDRAVQQLATDAGKRLGDAGMRAWKRSDAYAAVNLLGRSTGLLPGEDAFRLELLCELGIALRAAGEPALSEETLQQAAAAAAGAGDGRVELRARLELAYARLLHGPEGHANELLDLAATAIPTLETLGDDRALGRAWLFVGFVHGGVHSRHASWQDAAERALLHYRRARFPTAACLGELAAALYYGATPVPEAQQRCTDLLADDALDRVGEANVRVFFGGLEAMRGRFDEARALVTRARAVYVELGQSALAATYGGAVAGDIELLAGDPAAAARELEEVCRLHEQTHNWSALSTRAADVAESLFLLGRVDEAEHWAATARSRAQADDLTVQPLWRAVRAKVLARRGEFAEAEALAREAVSLAGQTDALNEHARVTLDLAEVLRAAGRREEAAAEVERAVTLYERKGNIVATGRARASLGQPAVA